MRTSLAALLLTALAGVARPALADDPPVLEVAPGQERTGLGTIGRCDDLSVVGISADGTGVRGLKPGSTICSFDTSGGGGIRRIYRVVVTAPKVQPPAQTGASTSGT